MQNEYDEILKSKFNRLKINIVKHDTSACGMPAYIEALLLEVPKDKGMLVLDLGNYIYRKFGISYQHTPEYREKSLRWFMSWRDIAPLQKSICEWYGKKVLAKDYLPLEFDSIPLQTGVVDQAAYWVPRDQIVIYRAKVSGAEIEFQAGRKRFVYMQAELGPFSDFLILGDM